MAVSLKSLNSSTTVKPPRILIYGVPGVGKSCLGIDAPKPVFIRTEDGLDGKMPDGKTMMETLTNKGGAAFDLSTTFDNVFECIIALGQEDHDFQTLVVDSCDWLESLLHQHVAKVGGHKSIEDEGYGKGYLRASETFREKYLDGINYLRDERRMTILQIAHSAIVRHNDPEVDPYDRYEIKMHKKASALLQEHSDCVLFCNYKVSTTKADVGFNKKHNRAVGTGERVIHTSDRPTHLAKNRYAMPDTLPMEWSAIAEHIPYFSQKKETKSDG